MVVVEVVAFFIIRLALAIGGCFFFDKLLSLSGRVVVGEVEVDV